MKTKTIRSKIGKTIKLFMIIWSVFYFGQSVAQNNRPVAIPDTVSVMTEDTVAIQVLLNDYDPDGDNIHVSSSYNPEHGHDWKNDSLVFYCSNYYYGQDSLRYRIKDDGSPAMSSEKAYIYVNVIENPNLPYAEDDSIVTLSQLPVEINVLFNDYDPNGDEIKILEIVKNPNYGSAVISSDSTIQYTSRINFTGVDYLRYTINEKNTTNQYYSNEATVLFIVEDNPNIPIVVDDEASTISFEPIEINALLNDYDPNNDEIMILDVGSSPNNSIQIISDSIIQYTSGFIVGTDNISYRIQEKNTANSYVSEWGSISINVELNPNIPNALSDSTSAISFEPVEINVLSNDYSPIGEPVEIWELRGGSVSFSDSIIAYVSNINVIGTQTFEYRIREINDTTIYSEWAKVYVDVSTNPNYPQAINDYASTIGGIPVTLNVIENDYNPSSDTIIMFSPNASYGNAELITDSIIQYTPYYSFEGIDSIKYLLRKQNDNTIYSLGYLIVDVQPSGSYAVLDGNNIKAGINSFGYMFGKLDYIPGYGPTNFGASFEAPAGSGIHSIFVSNIWIGGLDDLGADSLHFAGERYKQGGDDYFYGPISDIYDEDYDRKYIRLWSLNDYQISYHINHYSDPGYEMFHTIASWPANGDVSNGQLEQMAPFEDKDNDGIYEPMEGDFPLIRGDQAVFFIFNDDRYIHTESQGTKLGVEIHAMAYSYKGLADSALANTVFVHYDIINRSDTTYYNTYLASFTELDIGNYGNDYIGCDVERGSFFAYDATSYDDDEYNIWFEDTIFGYHDKLAAQSVSIIAGPFMDDDGIDNPLNNCDEGTNGLNFGNGINDDERMGMTRFVYYYNSVNNTAISDPYIASEYYSYMQGLWKDLTPIQYGGCGYLSLIGTVGPECKFMFPGDSDPCNWGTNGIPPNGGYNQNGKYWIEETGNSGNPNPPGDRRGLGVSGPFTFESGDVQQFDLAFVFARDYVNTDTITPKNILFQRIDSVIQFVQSKDILGFNQTLDMNEYAPENLKVMVYPNPNKQDYINILVQSTNSYLNYKLFDNYGRIHKQGNLVGNQVNQISLKGISNGIYIIQILDSNSNVMYIEKIINH